METFDIDEVALNFSPESLQMLNISLGIIIFGVALNLSLADFKRLIKKPKLTFIGISSQWLILPLVTMALIWLLRPNPSLAIGMVLISVCPGGNISNFMALQAKGNPALSISLTAFTSLFAVIITPLSFAFWTSLLPEVSMPTAIISLNFVDMAKIIGISLAAPLLSGMCVAHYFPSITERLKNPIKYLSLIIFAIIVILALAKNFSAFLTFWHLIVFLVLIHNAVALLAGYAWASLFKIDIADRRTISLETGIQNAALGLILIFNFFDGIGGMAIVAAWWGIWHIISGLTLSFYWGRKSSLGAHVQ